MVELAFEDSLLAVNFQRHVLRPLVEDFDAVAFVENEIVSDGREQVSIAQSQIGGFAGFSE